MKINRRKLIKNSSMALGLASVASISAKAAGICKATPINGQPEGPFFPTTNQQENQLDKDNDLTRIKGNLNQPIGEHIQLIGRVVDEACKPLSDVLVEIWQACESGRYNHPNDPNQATLDENFQYWGRAITNAKGEYNFKTIKPGSYPASNEWVRPPHIHMKVSLVGYNDLTTQLYFSDEEDLNLNSSDLILNSLSKDEQDKVIIDFKPSEIETLPAFSIYC